MLDILLSLVVGFQPLDQLDSASLLARWLAEVEASDLAFAHQERIERVQVSFAAAHETLELGRCPDILFVLGHLLIVTLCRAAGLKQEWRKVITRRVLVNFQVFLCEWLRELLFDFCVVEPVPDQNIATESTREQETPRLLFFFSALSVPGDHPGLFVCCDGDLVSD